MQRKSMTTAATRLGLLSATFLVASVATCADEPVRLRVLSYNIHHAEGIDRKLDLERIAGVISSAQPDFVALQEVDWKATRSALGDQPAELARLTKMNVAFGSNIPLLGGEYGNAVLSRFHILRHKNHLLPNFHNGEQRGVIVAEIEVPKLKESLLFFATHLDHRPDDAERVASAKFINRLASGTQRPALLVGDLNDIAESRTLRELKNVWTQSNQNLLPTIPVAEPNRQIDFIMFTPRERWKVMDARVLDEAIASDHRAIFAELELPAGN